MIDRRTLLKLAASMLPMALLGMGLSLPITGPLIDDEPDWQERLRRIGQTKPEHVLL